MRDHESRHNTLLVGWNSPPNVVTYTRILLVFIFIGFAVAAGPWGQDNHAFRWIATALFALAAATDKLDGWLARTYGNVTELGTLLDPIADKLLICSALVIASAFDNSGEVIAASQTGKYKTFTQCVGLGMLLAPVWLFHSGFTTPMWLTIYYTITYALIYIALILCLYSGAVYVFNVCKGARRG